MSSVLTNVQTAADIYNKQSNAFLTTGCTAIDNCLKGGIIRNSITEITGEASAGKSQLAIQLAVHSILPENQHGANGKTLYIETEGSFPLNRLHSIATVFCKHHNNYSLNDITENIYIHSTRDFEGLLSLINSLENRLDAQGGKPIRLVIIDSIASLFRGEVSLNYLKRSEILRSLYYKMNYLCQNANLTFVIINQITAAYNENPIKITSNPSIPALGPTVTQFTQNRYMICRRNSTIPASSVLSNSDFMHIHDENHSSTPSEQIRDLYVLFSSYLGCRQTSFTVTVDGVVSLSLVSSIIHMT